MLTDVTPRKANRARFLESEWIGALDLPQDGCLRAIAKSIESAMKEGENADVTGREFVELRCGIQKLNAGTSDACALPNLHRRLNEFSDRRQLPVLRQVESLDPVAFQKTCAVLAR